MRDGFEGEGKDIDRLKKVGGKARYCEVFGLLLFPRSVPLEVEVVRLKIPQPALGRGTP